MVVVGDTRSHSVGTVGSQPDQSLDLDSIAVGSTTTASSNNTTFSEFARRLTMRYLKGGGESAVATPT